MSKFNETGICDPTMKLEINTKEELHHNSTKEQTCCPTFEESMEECRHVIELCIKNQFERAIEICDKWSETSLYHSHGKSLLMFLKAVLTLETPEIALAVEAANKTNELCHKYRKSQSITTSVSKYLWKPNYNDYREEEIHAELVNAENLFIIAMLTFFGDQNIMSLVKGAFRIRSCQSIYKLCSEIAENRTEWKSESSKINFISGVWLGNGAMNLVFSHMPKRVLRILELIGFSGDRVNGLKLLNQCCRDETGLRFYFGQLVLSGYECYVNQIFGASKSNLVALDEFADKGLEFCEQSACFLFLKARIFQLRGNMDNAIAYFNKCIEAQNELKQLHNISHWELLWCHAIKFEWDEAANEAQVLIEQCNWSAATFTYQKATFLYMKMIDENKPEMHEHISELFRRVPTLKVRIAGKTIPPEKYVCVNAVKYFNQNETLVLPAFELFYIWHIFAIIQENSQITESILIRINKLIPKYINDKESVNAIQNYLLLLLLKGICHKLQKDYESAEKCFTEIMKNEKHIKTDKHILPMASLEMGLTKLDAKSYIEAKQWLKKAENDYTGYLFETAIHFRAHSGYLKAKRLIKKTAESKPMSN